MNLPNFLQDAIKNNTTSLGNHPAFPPDEEFTFIDDLIYHQYNDIMSQCENYNKKDIISKLNKLITECKKEEENLKPALEKLCNDLIIQIFDIPEDTITIETNLVDNCDMSVFRMIPDKTDSNFRFDSIESMTKLSDMIYQRRMLNVLITGASIKMAYDFSTYANEIFKINPNLINLYNEIYKYNLILLYNQPDSLQNIERTTTGSVKVDVGNENEQIKIHAEGVIFPVLLEYTIRGILEVASLKGLPEDIEQANFILSKSDYRLAENWDMRLGIPLWGLIQKVIDECCENNKNIKPNFYIMELSCMDNEEYINYLQNVFKNTKLGHKLTTQLINYIIQSQEYDEFDDFMKQNNQKYSINDSEYTVDELLAEIEN